MVSDFISAVLDFLDAIPELYTQFVGFLHLLFSWMPAGCLLLITFGLAFLVVVGIIRLVRRC